MLLTQVQQPNVPLQVKVQAVELAQQILVIAQQQQPVTGTSAAPVQPATTSTAPTAPAPDVSSPSGQAAPVATTTPVVPAPTCMFNGAPVVWPQGTTHALFTWKFTDGASASINTDLYQGARVAGSIHASDSAYQEDTYGPALFGSQTYTLTVTKDGVSTSCDATVKG